MFILVSFLLLARISSSSDFSDKSDLPSMMVPLSSTKVPSKSGVGSPLFNKFRFPPGAVKATESPLQSNYIDTPTTPIMPSIGRTYSPTR